MYDNNNADDDIITILAHDNCIANRCCWQWSSDPRVYPAEQKKTHRPSLTENQLIKAKGITGRPQSFKGNVNVEKSSGVREDSS